MADVTIDGSISTSTGRIMRAGPWFKSADSLVGYIFYIDSAGTFVYSKTTDGGATWGAAVTINSATTHIAADTWADWATPGDTGTKIHCAYFDSTNDIVRWRTLDTASDTLGTERAAFTGASAVATRRAYCSVTKTRSGYIYIAFIIDNAAEIGLVRSTDSGTTWSANLSAAIFADHTLLFPATGTGDDNDCFGLLQATAGTLQFRFWDSSAAASGGNSSTIPFIVNTTDLTGQNGFSAAVRNSDGHIILALFNDRDTATADGLVYDVSCSTSTWTLTAKTAITTNIDDIYYPSVFINQNNDDIYVAYNGKRDGSETLGTTTKIYYTKSTDDGTTWSSGDTAYQEGATSANFQVWCATTGSRFYVAWRVGTTLIGNKVNSVVTTNAYTIVCDQGAFALNGQTVAFGRGRQMAVTQGAYALNGQTAGLFWNRYTVVLPMGSYALNGQVVNLLRGRLIAITQGAFALGGQVVNLLRGRLIALVQGSYLLNGQAVILAKGRIIVIVQGAYSLNGQAINFARGRIVALVQGAFALTGQAVNFLRSRILPLAQGSFTLNGQTVTLTKAKAIAITQGSFALNGQAVMLLFQRILSVTQGSFTLNGQTVNLLRSKLIPITQGSFLLNGQAVAMLKGRVMPLTQGAYALSGQAVILIRGRAVVPVTGSFALNGQTVNFLRGRRITITQGSYALNGQTVTLTYTPVGAFVLPVNTGFFSLAGQSVGLQTGRRIPITQGSYSLNGQTVTFKRGLSTSIVTGSFLVNGQPVTFQHGRNFVLNQGAFNMSGQLIEFRRGIAISVNQGAYAVSGTALMALRGRVITLETGFYIFTGFDTESAITGETYTIYVAFPEPVVGVIPVTFDPAEFTIRVPEVLPETQPTIILPVKL